MLEKTKSSKIAERRTKKQVRKAVEKVTKATKEDVKPSENSEEELKVKRKRGRREVPVEEYVVNCQKALAEQ